MAEDLYGLPLEEFTAARDAAAKALRKEGDREAAAELAKLPKPTPAAWAANQVARSEPDVLEEFLEAGAALREAQEAALAGDAGGLREATRAQRAAVDAFMQAAAPLKPAGRPLSRAMSDRLRTTLLAAAGNEELSAALAEGRLALEAQAGGAWPPPDAEERAAAPRSAARRAPARAPRGDDEGRRIVTDTNKRAARRRAAPDEASARELAHAERDRAARHAGSEGAAPEPEDAAARERAAAERAAERAAREEAKREREALERQLREARGALKVRQRAVTAAEKDAGRAAARLQAALAEAEEARVESEAMDKVLAEARAALDGTRDEVARLEERLD